MVAQNLTPEELWKEVQELNREADSCILDDDFHGAIESRNAEINTLSRYLEAVKSEDEAKPAIRELLRIDKELTMIGNGLLDNTEPVGDALRDAKKRIGKPGNKAALQKHVDDLENKFSELYLTARDAYQAAGRAREIMHDPKGAGSRFKRVVKIEKRMGEL